LLICFFRCCWLIHCLLTKRLQEGETLGDLIRHAFSEAFEDGHQRVVIIGRDRYELTSGIIDAGYEALSHQDVVIEPALDGGYHLFGMKKCVREIFDNKYWGGGNLYADAVRQLLDLGNSYQSLVE
jgi:glycosyltransferase A (GT-A) superfamily protein (DUF2064 family)